jgi:hypothetical protein
MEASVTIQPNLFGEFACPMCAGSGRVTEEMFRHYIEDMPGQVGTLHPDTSHKAASHSIPRWGTQRYSVLGALITLGGTATAAEVAVNVNLSRNQTATRLGELREGGFVAYARDEAGARVSAPTGPTDEGLVQVITPAGRQAYWASRRGPRGGA